ncbi:MAG: UTP--glucose-1-phosphate uridylyltransferase [Fibrobacterales bacterium]
MSSDNTIATTVLGTNASLFSKSELDLIAFLCSNSNVHLFSDWDDLGISDDKKKAFIQTLVRVNGSYSGGLTQYIANAQRLLAASKSGANPFEGYVPEKPDGVDLRELNETYLEYESYAESAYDKVGFVLVAGGLGERLGYGGIKIDIPFEGITGQTYLQYYCETIKAMEQRSVEVCSIPFIIMTSKDTHEQTVASLERHNYFGLKQEQIHLLMQELVPAIVNNDGGLALNERYDLDMKPHGHGDVHMLIHSSGLAKKLHGGGTEYLLFIQDTNGQIMNAAPAFLGASIKHDYDFNIAGATRIPGEAVGALTKLVKGDHSLSLNVEYNQLDPLLRATISPEGDVADENGLSLYPGNTNALIIKLSSYIEILDKSQGIIAEFVNPKYADASKETFKKPTRLETMMQDYPKLLEPQHKAGVTLFDRAWSFSGNKNNAQDAAAKFDGGSNPECASTAERDYYVGNSEKLRFAGSSAEKGMVQLFLGLPYQGPQVVIKPSTALSVSEVVKKFKQCTIASDATLVVEGSGVTLDNVTIESGAALVVRAVEGAEVEIKDLTISNNGYSIRSLSDSECAIAPESVKMRGYQFDKGDVQSIEIDEPGYYLITDEGNFKK